MSNKDKNLDKDPGFIFICLVLVPFIAVVEVYYRWWQFKHWVKDRVKKALKRDGNV